MFALVDANAFYCSAEQVFRPDWRGKPIIVLSNNDGCVVAANRQAKAAGVPKFVPYFQIKDLCQKKGVIALSSNYELYGDLSAKMMQVIGRFAPEQHIYSIDESFLSFAHCYPAISCLNTQGKAIRRAVWKELRLPVCVGMGSTLTLSKIANHAAKKISGFKGVCVIDSEYKRQTILKQLEVGDVWGIGRRLSKKLLLMNIKTAFDLAQMPAGLARKKLSIEVERTVRELNGQICKQWDEARADKKQIFSTRSVGERITDINGLHQALCKHAGIAAVKARNQGSSCKSMLVFASNSPFDERPQSFKAVVHFPCPTDDTTEISFAVSTVIPKLFREGVRYYKIGIGLIDLAATRHAQFDLFSAPKSNSALMKVYDGINRRYGKDTLFLAAQGVEQKWSMRRDLLTPQYTTQWGSLPKIRC